MKVKLEFDIEWSDYDRDIDATIIDTIERQVREIVKPKAKEYLHTDKRVKELLLESFKKAVDNLDFDDAGEKAMWKALGKWMEE